jgi:uncharacterized protein (DUF1330 family)
MGILGTDSIEDTLIRCPEERLHQRGKNSLYPFPANYANVAASVRAGSTTTEADDGGRYLARTGNFERVEGGSANPDLQVIIEWPSKEAALAFYNDPAYQPYLQSRLAGASSDFFLVAGEDIAVTN